jgi:hypothetical protein
MNEADRLLRSIMGYALKKRSEGLRDFMQIMESYSHDVLSTETASNVKSERYSQIIKEYGQKDPVTQSRLSFY